MIELMTKFVNRACTHKPRITRLSPDCTELKCYCGKVNKIQFSKRIQKQIKAIRDELLKPTNEPVIIEEIFGIKIIRAKT